MKFVKVAVLAVFAASMLAGCCGGLSSSKCYPYPLYDYSPAKVCGSACQSPCGNPCR
jgi:hypothetical protein